MKTIVIPADVECKDPRTGALVCTKSMKDVAFDLWLNDPKVGNKAADLARWIKVCDKFAACLAGEILQLEDQDYKTLRGIVEEPQAAYPPIVGMQLLSFTDAILNAS